MNSQVSAHKKSKILFVITKSNWGGAQRYVYTLATALRETFDVAVAFGGTGEHSAKEGLLARKLKDYSIRTIFISSFMRDISPLRDIQAIRELTELFKKEKPDIAHLNSSKAGGVGALAARRAGVKKIIFTSHGLAYDEDRNPFARFIIFLSTWFTFLLCHEVITISQDTFARARRLPFCRNKISLIYNSITPIEGALPSDSARKHLGLHTEGIVIGTVAELTKNKGLVYLIEAARILKNRGHRFTLAIIGDGEDKESLKAYAITEDVDDMVRFAGFVPNAYLYLNAFDIFTLTSIKEGLPYVLLEAGSLERPVVASNISGALDIIDDGKSGLLFESKNSTDLAQKLELCITNPPLRTLLGKTLAQKIETYFSPQRMLEKTTELYRP